MFQEQTSTRLAFDGEPPITVTVRPLGHLFGVFVDEAESPLGVGSCAASALYRAMHNVRQKLRDIREVVQGEARARTLYRRLYKTLQALDTLGKAG